MKQLRKFSQGALEDVSLYSIMEEPDDILRMLRVYLRYRAVLQRCYASPTVSTLA